MVSNNRFDMTVKYSFNCVNPMVRDVLLVSKNHPDLFLGLLQRDIIFRCHRILRSSGLDMLT